MGFDSYKDALRLVLEERREDTLAAAYNRMLAHPPMYTLLRAHYKCIPKLLRPSNEDGKALLRRALDARAAGEAHVAMVARVEKLVSVLANQAHSSNPNLREWADVCSFMRDDANVRELVWVMLDAVPKDSVVETLVRTSTSAAASECCRSGVPVLLPD